MITIARSTALCLLALSVLACPALASAALLTDLEVRDAPQGEVELLLSFDGAPGELTGYALEAPPRLALDLANTQNGLAERSQAVGLGGVERITTIEGGGRTRLIVDLSGAHTFRSAASPSRLSVFLTPTAIGSQPPVASTPSAASVPTAPPSPRPAPAASSGPSIEDIDFRRGANGAGRLLVTFSQSGVNARVEEAGLGVVNATLPGVTLPASLDQILDVTDFATPINRITPRTTATGTQLELQTQGPYALLSSQSGRVLTIDVEPVATPADSLAQEAEERFTGDRLSLNFQDIEVRSVLATLAEFTGLNLVASDSVTGRVTLNLNDVPWDQALALILQSQGLSSREQGNVIVIAPAGELAEVERQQIESRNQRQTLAPLVTEFIEVRYARAEDFAQLLRGAEGFGLLTDRGRVSVDQRTNTLLVQDTADQLREIVATLDRLDVAVRQVQIEARIVIARDNASRELGVNWSASSTRGFQINEFGQGVRRDLNPQGLSRARGGLAVDLGPGAVAGTGFSFGYLSGDVLLDLELRALESEGKSQTISQPRIITANQRTATIRQGEERAFQSVDAEGNPDTQFKEAELSLEVTPQITPDNRIIMDLVIKNDSFRESEFGGEPPIDTNQIETQVLVDNGQTVVLGGILTTEQLSQISKTPLLGDLPLLGRLFRYNQESNEKVELLVFITPRLLDDGLTVR
ncbi:type IV pilus secretin PilQ [Halomonas sp. PAMB 3264]|uniref:type IV pilus secretin PilQ n=1 Tax=Halomonas sp. PAMB 3264 TaxID=3075222 RepID=UPI00289DF7E9|nr:type IV pilus secretin PilQ [Halomonas sp. PAMB 3264]WNL43038.1 type IV pilus secretin PilQ [Halomonas sp. PAMB 3264]